MIALTNERSKIELEWIWKLWVSIICAYFALILMLPKTMWEIFKLPKFFEHWAFFSQNAQNVWAWMKFFKNLYHHLPFYYLPFYYQTETNFPQNCLIFIFFSSIRNFPECNILRFFLPFIFCPKWSGSMKFPNCPQIFKHPGKSFSGILHSTKLKIM